MIYTSASLQPTITIGYNIHHHIRVNCSQLVYYKAEVKQIKHHLMTACNERDLVLHSRRVPGFELKKKSIQQLLFNFKFFCCKLHWWKMLSSFSVYTYLKYFSIRS